MEKYGVNQTKEAQTKHASDEKRCAVCSRPLTAHGSVLLCKTHGSAPLEDTSTHED